MKFLEDYQEIYRQYWLQARHVENQRLWYTNFYAVLTAGTLAFLGTSVSRELIWVPLVFLLLLALIGYLIGETLSFPYIFFSRFAEVIAIKELGLKSEYRRYYGKFKRKPLSHHDLIQIFYSITSGGVLGAIAAIFSGEQVLSILMGIGLTTILLLLYYVYLKPQNKKVSEHIDELVANHDKEEEWNTTTK